MARTSEWREELSGLRPDSRNCGADDRKGSCLVFHSPRPDGPDVAITPAVVAQAIRMALKEGWVPGSGDRDENFELRSEVASKIETLLWSSESG